jgi:hypothetical protein
MTLKLARIMVDVRIDFAAANRNWLMMAEVELLWNLKFPPILSLPITSSSALIHRFAARGSSHPMFSISSIYCHLADVDEMSVGVEPVASARYHAVVRTI